MTLSNTANVSTWRLPSGLLFCQVTLCHIALCYIPSCVVTDSMPDFMVHGGICICNFLLSLCLVQHYTCNRGAFLLQNTFSAKCNVKNYTRKKQNVMVNATMHYASTTMNNASAKCKMQYRIMHLGIMALISFHIRQRLDFD